MVLMLINSAIALALPNYVIKNYKYWKKGNYDNRIIKIYTFISLGLFFTLLSVYNIDKLYFGILGYYGKEIIPLIFIIYFYLVYTIFMQIIFFIIKRLIL